MLSRVNAEHDRSPKQTSPSWVAASKFTSSTVVADGTVYGTPHFYYFVAITVTWFEPAYSL
jgi:hypothetical protein